MPTSLGPAEIVVILVVALIVLGPNRLPEAGRQVGKAVAEVRRWSQGVQSEIRQAMEPEPEVEPPPAMPEPAPEPPAFYAPPAPSPPSSAPLYPPPPAPPPPPPSSGASPAPTPDAGASGGHDG